ncbi:MAG: putative cytokinetic ring protein SteA [bacterium]
MRFSGPVKIDRRTKNLVRRLQPDDIACIVHDDLDVVAAENLVERRPAGIINCLHSITGKYVNRGPFLLLDAGIPLVDGVGTDILKALSEGDIVDVVDGRVLTNGGEAGMGTEQTYATLNKLNQVARENLEFQIEQFADNTLSFLKKEKALLHGDLKAKHLPLNFAGRHVLVVVRGPDFKQDLETINNYIREKNPVLVAVDGGADALMEMRYKPDVILGDMDSVSDETLRTGALLIVHAYESGEAPGTERLERELLPYYTLSSIGTSEDLALLLAHEFGADIIVLVGSHFSMDEFLSKGRGGMASTFLTRLRVGSILVDAKGVSKLYSGKVHPILLVYLILAAAFPVLAILFVSPLSRQFVRLFRLFLNL